MTYPIPPPVKPMLAALKRDIPTGGGWLYEPKWDGFRAIVFRDGDDLRVDSRNGQPLLRYFPEMRDMAAESFPQRCVLDGEIVIPGPLGLDFDALQQRIHPADSRVQKLMVQTPAAFVPFDMLADGDRDLREEPMTTRRRHLVEAIRGTDRCFATPQTDDEERAARWFVDFEGAGLDGVMAKRADQRYVAGKRVMVKVKHERTADVVVGGYRLNKDRDGIGSLLLGAFDDEQRFQFLGFTSSFKAQERRDILDLLRSITTTENPAHARLPGEPSRWSAGKDASWFPVRLELVCEVAYDHLQGGWRFRHGTTFKRWRPDKNPGECTFDQFDEPAPFAFADIRTLSQGQD